MVAMLSIRSAAGQTYRSHPPMRPLPTTVDRPLTPGRAWFVDPTKGDDANTGTQEQPWRTIGFAVERLQPGDVLYLRSGTYYEHVVVQTRGTAAAPITIRGYPGELVILDGGLREFLESPATSWEPCPDGVPGEFRSTKSYPEIPNGFVFGSFGDSMIPLQGYRFFGDLRSSNEYFGKLGDEESETGGGIYCGPGLFFEPSTKRYHIRLSHTHQLALSDDNYRGETDPRKIPLVVSGSAASTLSLKGAQYVRVQDVVVRGSRNAAISVNHSINVEFHGVTSYGGSSAFSAGNTAGLRLWDCACRGLAAPWTYRGSLKYRSIEAKIFSASGWTTQHPGNHDFELAYSEFTDCVDGVFIGNVKRVRFHHNLLDNVSDDGLFLTSTTSYDGLTPGGDIEIYQNRLSRNLTTFAFGEGHGRQKMTTQGLQTGSGLFIYRNLFDFRRPVMYSQPKEEASENTSFGRVAGDHGGPKWEPMTIYHNTILKAETPYRNYYLDGMGGNLAGGSMRRVFNNLIVHFDGKPGHVLPAMKMPDVAVNALPSTSAAPDPLAGLLDGDFASGGKKREFSKEVNAEALSELETKMAKAAIRLPPVPIDFQADGNLHWSYSDAKKLDKLFADFRGQPEFAATRSSCPPGWTAHDVVADPQFVAFEKSWRRDVDCRLQTGSPAADAGVALTESWPDPLRAADEGRPDIGAIPNNAPAWRIGVRGRWTLFGAATADSTPIAAPEGFVLDESAATRLIAASTPASRTTAIVEGYPAADAPLMRFALSRARGQYESFERQWLDPAEYGKYGLVVLVGDLRRANLEPNFYDREQLTHVDRFLREGGTLLLMRGASAAFSTPEGQEYLAKLTGGTKRTAEPFEVLQPDHPWLQHLDPRQLPVWLNSIHDIPIQAENGNVVLGGRDGRAVLYQLPVGRGQLVYFGWEVSAGRGTSPRDFAFEKEIDYEQQMQILLNVIRSIVTATQP